MKHWDFICVYIYIHIIIYIYIYGVACGAGTVCLTTPSFGHLLSVMKGVRAQSKHWGIAHVLQSRKWTGFFSVLNPRPLSAVEWSKSWLGDW